MLLKMLLEMLLTLNKRRMRRRTRRERIRRFPRCRQFQVIAIFRPYDPSLLDFRRSSSKNCWRGGEAVSLASISISTTPSPAISKDTRKIRESRHTAVEEQVVVTSAQDPANPSKSMSLYLCLRPKACRKTMTPPIAARTECETPGRGYCQKKSQRNRQGILSSFRRQRILSSKSQSQGGYLNSEQGILFRGLHLGVLLSHFMWRTYLVKLFGGDSMV